MRELKRITDVVDRLRQEKRQTRRDILRRAAGVALTIPAAVIGRYAMAESPPLPKLPAVPAGDAVLLTPGDLQFAVTKGIATLRQLLEGQTSVAVIDEPALKSSNERFLTEPVK